MNGKDDLPIVTFESQDAWEAWLDEQHDFSSGVWLKIGKKDAGVQTVSYAEALEIGVLYPTFLSGQG